jgi:hypothetical protein
MVREAGVETRLHSWFSRAIVEDDRIRGVADSVRLLSLPAPRGVAFFESHQRVAKADLCRTIMWPQAGNAAQPNTNRSRSHRSRSSLL